MTTCTALSKFCSACQTTLPADHFFKHGGHKDGLQTKCRSCTNERNRDRRTSPDATQMPRATRELAKPAKKLTTVIVEAPEPIVTFPPIRETEHRGQNRVSYSFQGPDESSFSFDDFKTARQEREKLRPLYLQTAIYDSTHRQSTAARRATAVAEDDFE